jgi:hypothetical protein
MLYCPTVQDFSATRATHVIFHSTLQFDNIRLGKSVTLSLIVAVDPYFTPNHNKDYHVAVLVNFWYYGEDGPCTRPPSLYNAHHVTGRLPIKFLSTTGEFCFKRVEDTGFHYNLTIFRTI